MESKCPKSNCRRRARVDGEQVSREQMSVGSKGRKSKCPGAPVVGATVWGAPFMESENIYKIIMISYILGCYTYLCVYNHLAIYTYV